MRFGKAVLALIGAIVVLGALVGSASAGRLSISSQTLRALFTSVTFNGVFGRISCEVQVEGSFHERTVNKVLGALVGFITNAAILRCAEGSATILRETLPWHVRYLGFTGRLPSIATITANIIGVSFRIRGPIENCLGRSTTARPEFVVFNREAGGAVATAEVGGTVPTDCFGAEGTFASSRAPVTVLNSTTRITVTLI